MMANELRQPVQRQCQVLRTIWAFNRCLGPENERHLNEIRRVTATCHTAVLRQYHQELAKLLAEAVAQFGCRKPPEQIADFLLNQTPPPGELYCFSKYDIERFFFSNFGGGAIRNWWHFPPHVLIAIEVPDVHQEGSVHTFLPELSLYLDMCVAFNRAVESQESVLSAERGEALAHWMYVRTALLSAYYFVEAYLNCVAFDYVARHETALDQEMKDYLLEWDSTKNCRRFRSVEEKIENYPRRISGTAHTLLLNSANRAVLLGDGKDSRDAIVHHSPKANPITGIPEKTRYLINLRVPLVARVVDAAVGLVKEINLALGCEGISSVDQFFPRGSDGRFPNTVFQQSTQFRAP